ncbi:DUF3823 domain-containing protein [Rubrolithibacter danxiaensis]|uniref:DUF3823 domain-containing protein n=1 Tax=Rubrolithibacter danxiaensis TaxID=3390805 RepID=UPI003BF7F7F5
MKIKFHFYILTVLIIAAISCKKDNYDAPSSTLSGRLVYNGDSIGVEANQVQFQLFQPGFGKIGPISQTFDQDGSYSALLFDGNYKFVIPNGQGPFMWKKTANGAPDSIAINLNGSQNLDIEVTPYYMVRNAQFTGSATNVTGSCQLEKIITDANARDIEKVILYINRTQFVSGGDYNVANAELEGSAIADLNSVSLSVTVPAISPVQNYVFARIGVKIAGVEDMIFSPVSKVQL